MSECFLSMHEALGSVSSPSKTKINTDLSRKEFIGKILISSQTLWEGNIKLGSEKSVEQGKLSGSQHHSQYSVSLVTAFSF